MHSALFITAAINKVLPDRYLEVIQASHEWSSLITGAIKHPLFNLRRLLIFAIGLVYPAAAGTSFARDRNCKNNRKIGYKR
jgi:hypothetical protein